MEGGRGGGMGGRARCVVCGLWFVVCVGGAQFTHKKATVIDQTARPHKAEAQRRERGRGARGAREFKSKLAFFGERLRCVLRWPCWYQSKFLACRGEGQGETSRGAGRVLI